jgi:hypothetical protein
MVQLSCYNQEYFLLNVVLQPGVSGVNFWRLVADRKYSVKLSYESFLGDQSTLHPTKESRRHGR